MTALHETESLVRDIAQRVGLTALEAGAAAAAVTWGGSGAGVGDLVHLNTAAKLATTIVLAFGSAALSAFINGFRAWAKIKANRDQLVQVGKDDFAAVTSWHPGASDMSAGAPAASAPAAVSNGESWPSSAMTSGASTPSLDFIGDGSVPAQEDLNTTAAEPVVAADTTPAPTPIGDAAAAATGQHVAYESTADGVQNAPTTPEASA